MSSPLLSTYLATLRKQHGLTQDELAALLSLTQSGICKFETGSRPVTIEVAFGCEVIFGTMAREVFPAAFTAVEDAVIAQSRLLHDQIEGRNDLSAPAKLALLKAMIHRAEAHDPTLWHKKP